MDQVADRLRAIHERIARAAAVAGRPAGDVRLVAVSKYQPVEAMREAYAAGVRDFGENYVQEIVRKSDQLGDLPDLRFHMIGHLQTNKSRQVAGRVSAIHSVDSARLAEELGKRCNLVELPAAKRWPTKAGASGGACQQALPVLIEVNLGGEAQKSGCAPDDTAAVLATIRSQPSLRAVGLMTVPPFSEDPSASRPYFGRLRELRNRLEDSSSLSELSMGMTLDLEHAILAGATVVRVGTAIFGERPPREDA
jgi:PLP dependent protein